MKWRKWGCYKVELYFLCERFPGVNYYSTDSNLVFVLVLISSHSWCVLPSGRPLIKPFSCRKSDNPSPHTLASAPFSSLPFAAVPVPPGAKPFHFTCPSAALNIISAFFPAVTGWVNHVHKLERCTGSGFDWLKWAVCLSLWKNG